MRTMALSACLLHLGLWVTSAAVAGQGILYPRAEVREMPFSVRSMRVDTQIRDSLAETTVEQVFVNHSAVEREGTYLFPLPRDASVSSFQLKAGDRVLEGTVYTREEARAIYESIVRQRRDPALLEYVGQNLFRASVFPIPPRGERTLTLRYQQVLRVEGGNRRYVFPLSTSRFSNRPPANVAVAVTIQSSMPIRTVYSPTHDISVRRKGEKLATASWETRGEYLDRDFVLYCMAARGEVGLTMLTQRTSGGGYFLLVATPPPPGGESRPLPRDVVFVLDRTGSMQANNKIGQAKAALSYCIDSLSPSDRFNVITFNEAPDLLFRGVEPVTRASKEKAHRYVSEVAASGGTNINEALETAVSQLRHSDRELKMVVFLTDGLPTVGETNAENILANIRRWNGDTTVASAANAAPDASPVNARIFCFGVGYDVNVPFLDRLAEQTRAECDYVRPEESVEGIVSSFFAKVAAPALAKVSLAFEGVNVHDVYPRHLPDLYGGGQLVVVGRYRGEKAGSLRLTGSAGGRVVELRLADAFGASAASSPLISRIWASRKIGYLLDQVRLHKNQEVIEEIVRLSREYGIITPYTAYLADERTAVVAREDTGEPWHLSYRLDAEQRVLRIAQEQVRSLADRRPENLTGAGAALGSLNSKQYQQASRAPAGVQGGFAGIAESGARSLLNEALGRRELGLDYGAVARLRPAAGTPMYRQVQAAASVQSVEGRVFYRRGAVWLDNQYQSGMPVLKIKALSDGHFQLLRARPDLRKYAAVGDEVVLVLGDRAIQIGAEGKEALTPAELSALRGS